MPLAADLTLPVDGRRRLAVAPADPAALFALGIADAAALGPARGTWFSRCLACDVAHTGAAVNRAVGLAAKGAVAAASRILRRTLAIDPGMPAALGNLGLVARSAGGTLEAIDSLSRILALVGPDALTLANLGAALWELERDVDAAKALRRALALVPELSLAAYNLALVAQARGDVTDALALFERVVMIEPANAFAHSNLLFCLAYHADPGNRRRAREARRWAQRHAWPLRGGARSWVNVPDPDRRLRVGYVSSDMRRHSVARNVEGLLRHHDRREVEIFVYSQTPTSDEVTRRLRASVDAWHDGATLSDGAIASAIHADRIDVLVLLGSHTGHNRPLVAAYRPAPVQISMHDLGTTGIDTIDYWMTDGSLYPSDSIEPFVETPMRLPYLYLHEPPAEAPEVSPLPSRDGGPITFASFNNPAKITRATLALWRRVLDAVPGSRLALKHVRAYQSSAARRRVLDGLPGIAPERVIFHREALGPADHLRLLATADIALDPFPFNGATTTFEALWMGLPVVALTGDCFVGRVSRSFLDAIGLPWLAADDADGYVEVAQNLAMDREKLAGLRGSMRGRVAASPLCQPAPYARAVERVYRSVWRRWCATPI